MTDLPPGWEWTTLGDLAAPERRAITDGPFGSALTSSHYTESGARVIRLQNIGDGDFIDDQSFISSDHYETLRKHEVRQGDLLVASLGDDPPRACIAPDLGGPAIVKADCIRVRLHEDVDSKWVLFALISPRTKALAREYLKGIGRPRLGLKAIKQLPIPLPPRAEQRRIVRELEAYSHHLAAVGDARITAAGRAIALNERCIEDCVSRASAGAREAALGDVVEEVRNGLFVSRAGTEENGVPILRISAVRPRSLRVSDYRYSRLSSEELRDRGLLLEGGDVLFTRYSGNSENVGTCALFTGADEITYPDKLIRVRVRRDLLLPEYLVLACTCGSTLNAIRAARKTTAGQVGISGSGLKSIQLCVPSLEAQRTAVAEADRLQEALGSALSTLSRAQVKISHLWRSILSRAIEGRLVAQDDMDVPASTVLERVMADRTAVKPAVRGWQNTLAK